MATRQTMAVTDDLDGSPGAQPVRFALDGVSYEIDLTDRHADELRRALAPYMAAGRRMTRTGRPYVRIDLDETSRRRHPRRGRRAAT